MDAEWERSIPYVRVDKSTAARLFRRFDPTITVERLFPLTEGKRTSNYRVSAAFSYRSENRNRDFLLRLFAPNDDSWKREAALRELLGGRVPMQRLLYADRDELLGNRAFAIYEYKEGNSLLELLLHGYVPEERLFREAGGILAAIHSHRYERCGFLDGRLDLVQELPPLEAWFELFLNANARDRLGPVMTERVVRLVKSKKPTLDRIDKTIALVHGDFRPTNLLVKDGAISCVLDWEFAHAGHPVADMAQLFRYEGQFQAKLKEAFVQGYTDRTDMALPEDWERLGRLRDLANLLQMIGADGDLPYKFADLRRLIGGTLQHFDIKPTFD